MPVPEAEPAFGAMRHTFEPAATLGVPAHVTLIVPFAPPPVSAGIVDELGAFFRAQAAIAVGFGTTGRFASTLFLAPQDPAELVGLIDALSRRYPQWPPYGGKHADIVPHLTVAEVNDDPGVLDDLEDASRALLPIDATLREAWLIESDETGWWHRRATFPFARAQGDEGS